MSGGIRRPAELGKVTAPLSWRPHNEATHRWRRITMRGRPPGSSFAGHTKWIGNRLVPIPERFGDHESNHRVSVRRTDATCRPEEGNSSLSVTRSAARRLNLVAANSNLRPVTSDARAWVSNALCRDRDPDELFVRGAAQREAAVICRYCPVIQECGVDALDNKVEYGIWGGMTERQRRALLKQHPEVVSWADFFNKRNTRSVG